MADMMSLGGDIELFEPLNDTDPAADVAGDIDLFIDDDFDFSDDEDEDLLGGLTPAQIIRAAEEFKNLFAGDGIEISSTTAAMSLFQSLQSIGFKANIDMTDTSVTIDAESRTPEQSDMLMETIENVLESLHNVAGHHYTRTNFVLRKMGCHLSNGKCIAHIEIVSV